MGNSWAGETNRERGREWGRAHCRNERRLGICRRLYATFLILISTENATKNKSTFWFAFLPYFSSTFLAFLSKLSARLDDVEFLVFISFFLYISFSI